MYSTDTNSNHLLIGEKIYIIVIRLLTHTAYVNLSNLIDEGEARAFLGVLYL